MYLVASVLILLEWQLRGHQGPHLMTVTITRVQRGETSTWCLTFQCAKSLPQLHPKLCVCVRLYVVFGVLQLAAALTW